MPVDWGLIDWSAQPGQASINVSPNEDEFIEGKTSLQLETKQDYVTISLTSPPFEVAENEIIQARCYVSKNNTKADSIRIVFHNKSGDAFYYSSTTEIKEINDFWKELISTVLVPKDSVKASLFLNIWGVVGKGKKVLFDNVRIVKRI